MCAYKFTYCILSLFRMQMQMCAKRYDIQLYTKVLVLGAELRCIQSDALGSVQKLRHDF